MSLTGFEIIDAIVTNPLEAIGLFGVSIIIYKLLFSRNSIFGDELRRLKWSLKYDLDNQLENLVDWLERRSIVYDAWAKKQTRKSWLKITLILFSCLFMPMIIWNMFLGDRTLVTNQILGYVMIIEYFALMTFAVYRYKHPRSKENKIEKTS